uniref:Smr domain-containing protein n=1 Tax=Caenorhabditis tropicalis TaxID=1561998 RepID=A0A1I7UWT1_9PELO
MPRGKRSKQRDQQNLQNLKSVSGSRSGQTTEKERFHQELSSLHEELKLLNSRSSEYENLELQIFKKVKFLNGRTRGSGEYDFHFLTVQRAVSYSKDIIAQVKRERKFKELSFITGAGNNSANGLANIKNALLEELRSVPGCSVSENKNNSGKLVVKIV